MFDYGDVVFHKDYGKGKVLMCSEDEKHCLVFFDFAIWVTIKSLKSSEFREETKEAIVNPCNRYEWSL